MFYRDNDEMLTFTSIATDFDQVRFSSSCRTVPMLDLLLTILLEIP